MTSNQTLRNWYLSFNRRYFHEQLPTDLVVAYGKCDPRVAAYTLFEDGHPTAIIVDQGLKGYNQYVKCLLLHEAAHVKVGLTEKAYHGPLWRAERRRLIEAGAFTTLL